jgi:predicted lysophospholipase L1 biosynthesis ABC-type transport system permease subunit
MVLPDQQFAEAPQTFFYSFKTNTQQKATIREIIKQKQRSNPLIIDIDNIINLVRQI